MALLPRKRPCYIAPPELSNVKIQERRLPSTQFDLRILDSLLLEAWRPSSRFPANRVRKVVEFLLEQGASANVMNGLGNTLLYDCVGQEEVEKVQLLLEFGTDPNHRYYVSGSTDMPLQKSCLSTAVDSGNQAMVALLLQHGACLPTSEAFVALRRGYLEVLRLLLVSGHSPSARDVETGLTLLETNLRDETECEADVWKYHKYKRRKFFDTFFKPDRKFTRLLVESGSPAPSAAVLQDAVSNNAFVTLINTYRVFLDAKRRLIWPDDLSGMTSRVVPKDAEVIILKVANILKELIRRTCTLSDNSGVMVRYLEELTGQTDKNANFPKLADLARSTVIGALNRLPVSRTLQETVGGMVMPWVFKEQLCLIDLARRLKAAKKL